MIVPLFFSSSELKAIAAIRLSIILVGADQPCHLAVAVINRALHAAIPLDAPDLPVEQVVGVLLCRMGPWVPAWGVPSRL